jgi:SEC-C motif-containing protein
MDFKDCCEPLIRKETTAGTAEQLMRSRYTAYVLTEIDYLAQTTHPDHRADFDPKAARNWSENSEWKELEIVAAEGGGPEDEEGIVEFIARFSSKAIIQNHHERAEFKKQDGQWYFVDGQNVKPKQVKRTRAKIGRNAPCPCGSGKKYKKCCG